MTIDESSHRSQRQKRDMEKDIGTPVLLRLCTLYLFSNISIGNTMLVLHVVKGKVYMEYLAEFGENKVYIKYYADQN